MKQIRNRLTYANVMSSIAVFLVIGGGAAFAALGKNTVGTKQLKNNAVTTAKIKKEAVATAKIKGAAIDASKLANESVTTEKIAKDAVTGEKVNEATLGTVPNASKLDGKDPGEFVSKSALLWAIVDENGTLVAGSGATAATRLSEGNFRLTFNRVVTGCATEGTATDISGGAAPQGTGARIVGTDNRVQTSNNTVDAVLTDPAGAVSDPVFGDGFAVTVYC